MNEALQAFSSQMEMLNESMENPNVNEYGDLAEPSTRPNASQKRKALNAVFSNIYSVLKHHMCWELAEENEVGKIIS